jgi:hypothetical protein
MDKVVTSASSRSAMIFGHFVSRKLLFVAALSKSARLLYIQQNSASACATLFNSHPPPAKVYWRVFVVKRHNGF